MNDLPEEKRIYEEILKSEKIQAGNCDVVKQLNMVIEELNEKYKL